MKETVTLELETYLKTQKNLKSLRDQVEFWENKRKEEVEEEVVRAIIDEYEYKIRKLEGEISDLEGCLFEERVSKKGEIIQAVSITFIATAALSFFLGLLL